MTFQSKIQGYINNSILSVLGLGGIIGTGMMLNDSDRYGVAADALVEKINVVYAASMRCQYELGHWCTTTEMSANGFYTGDFISPMGTAINLDVSGETLIITIDTLNAGLAKRAAPSIAFSSVNNAVITAEIKKPSQSDLLSDRLARYANDTNVNATRLETDIDFNNNNLSNVDTLSAQDVAVDTLEMPSVVLKEINPTTIILGEHTILADGSILRINANNADFVDINIQGDVIGNDGNITGVDEIQAQTLSLDSLQSTSVTANTAVITTVSGDIVTFDIANIDMLTTTDLTAITGDVNTLIAAITNVDTLNVNSGVLNTLFITTGTINSVSGSSLNFDKGVVTTLNGVDMTANTAQGISVNSNSVSAELLVADSAIIDSVSGNSLTGTSAEGQVLTSNNATINQATVESASGVTINADNATGTTIDADNATGTTIEANDVTATTIDAQTLDVTSYFAQAMDIDKTLTANVITSNTSANVKTATIVNGQITNNVNVAGMTTANEMIVQTSINGTNANIRNLSATDFTTQTLNATNINSVNYTGGDFYASDDFTSSDSSVNQNYLALTTLSDDLDNCINVTQYCVAKAPIVSLSCSNCNQSFQRPNFAGVATATIATCRQGCDYEWVVSGVNLSFAGCIAGSISPGNGGSPECNVSASLLPQEFANGTIEIQVTNSAKPSLSSSASASVSYMNITPDDPFIDIEAGCHVDDDEFNTTTQDSCGLIVYEDESIYYSVGDDYDDVYNFSNPSDWSVVWSGDCTASAFKCSLDVALPSNPTETYTAVATVTHISSGQTKTFTVVGTVTPGT